MGRSSRMRLAFPHGYRWLSECWLTLSDVALLVRAPHSLPFSPIWLLHIPGPFRCLSLQLMLSLAEGKRMPA